jgi:hypothetical protein
MAGRIVNSEMIIQILPILYYSHHNSSHMALKTLLIAFLFCTATNKLPVSNPTAAEINSNPAIQDTLPPLHTIKKREIDKISTSFENQTISILLKSGAKYIYHHIDWDFEDHYPSIAKPIQDSLRSIEMTFTRVEQPPVFPGGEEAWEKYIREFCQIHKNEIGKQKSAEFEVEFIVHLHGQIENVQVIVNKDGSALSKLAEDAIKNGPLWVPAVQNERKVVAIEKKLVKIGL